MNRKIILLASFFAVTGSLLIGCSREIDKIETNNTNGNDSEIVTDKEDKSLILSNFIPNGNYKVAFTGSDLSNELLFLSGNGTYYYAIGVSGKGYYVEKFEVIDNELCFKDKADIENIENIKSLDDIKSLLDKDLMNGDKIVVLRENPTDLDSFKIVERGTDLKLDNIQLKGDYLKVSETKSDSSDKTIIDTYYSEGLGVVKYEVIFNDTIMDYSELISYEEVKN